MGAGYNTPTQPYQTCNFKVIAGTTTTQPSTLSFTANPTQIVPGGSSTLFWTATNCPIPPASGSWSGAKALSGSETKTNITANQTCTLAYTGTKSTLAESFDPNRLELETDFTFLKRPRQEKNNWPIYIVTDTDHLSTLNRRNPSVCYELKGHQTRSITWTVYSPFFLLLSPDY